MQLAAQLIVALVGLIHVYIFALETFLWERPAGLRAFAMTRERAADTKVLAINQGVYNGFLAAGLFWGLSQGADGADVQAFFLICVFVAGVVGAATFSRKILFVQSVPAALGLLLLFLA